MNQMNLTSPWKYLKLEYRRNLRINQGCAKFALTLSLKDFTSLKRRKKKLINFLMKSENKWKIKEKHKTQDQRPTLY